MPGGDSAGGCPTSAPITALLFKALNLSYPGLEAVKAAVAAGDQGVACSAVAAYYATSKHAPWLRHAAPAVGTALAGGAVDATMLNDTYDFYGESDTWMYDRKAIELVDEPVYDMFF